MQKVVQSTEVKSVTKYGKYCGTFFNLSLISCFSDAKRFLYIFFIMRPLQDGKQYQYFFWLRMNFSRFSKPSRPPHIYHYSFTHEILAYILNFNPNYGSCLYTRSQHIFFINVIIFLPKDPFYIYCFPSNVSTHP